MKEERKLFLLVLMYMKRERETVIRKRETLLYVRTRFFPITPRCRVPYDKAPISELCVKMGNILKIKFVFVYLRRQSFNAALYKSFIHHTIWMEKTCIHGRTIKGRQNNIVNYPRKVLLSIVRRRIYKHVSIGNGKQESLSW